MSDRRRPVVLTDAAVKALKPRSQRYSVSDALVPGLLVRVQPSGRKSYALWKRWPPSAPSATARILGRVGELSLSAARDKARLWLDMRAKGLDPREVEREQRAREAATRETAADVFTFRMAAEAYIKRRVPTLRRAKDVEREIRQELIARWGDKPLADVTRTDVAQMVQEIVDRGALGQASVMLGRAKALFSWCVERHDIDLAGSPADGLKRSSLIGRQKARDRVLSDLELAALWRVTGRLGHPWEPLLRLLVLSALRRSEVAEAKWREFDPAFVRLIQAAQTDEPVDWDVEMAEHPEWFIWTIPADRMKAGVEHRVPLTRAMVEIVAGLPTDGAHLLRTAAGASPVLSLNRVKAEVDGAMELMIRAETRRLGGDWRRAKLAPWTVHDIRRTVRTRLSQLGVQYEIAELILAHGKQGMNAVYNQWSFVEERQQALDRWARRLHDIVTPRPPADVIPIRERSA